MVDVVYTYPPGGQPNLLDVSVSPVMNTVNHRVSTSSGYLGDNSSVGSDMPQLVQPQLPPPFAPNRMSTSSSSSSASAIRNFPQKQPPNVKHINDLLKKWKNSKLLFNLLHELDKTCESVAHSSDNATLDDDGNDSEDPDSKPDDSKKPGSNFRMLKRPHTATSDNTEDEKKRKKKPEPLDDPAAWVDAHLILQVSYFFLVSNIECKIFLV